MHKEFTEPSLETSLEQDCAGCTAGHLDRYILSEYWAVQPVRLELSYPIRLDQLTHFGQYTLRQCILPVAYGLRLQYNH
jgi:hypothetical protein